MNVLPSIHPLSIQGPSLSLPHPDLHLHRRQSRGRRISPLAAGVAGGGAVAIIAYRKRQAVKQAMTEEMDAVSASGESHMLRRHTGDLIALEREMQSSLQGQLDDGLVDSVPGARDVVRQAVDMLAENAGRLEQELGGASQRPSAMMKKFLAMTAGKVAPLIGSARPEPASRMLRDDAVGLHLAAASASMLHSAATAEHQPGLAAIALDGSEACSLLADEVQKLLPDAVTMEVEQRQEAMETAANAGDDALPEPGDELMTPVSGSANGAIPRQ